MDFLFFFRVFEWVCFYGSMIVVTYHAWPLLLTALWNAVIGMVFVVAFMNVYKTNEVVSFFQLLLLQFIAYKVVYHSWLIIKSMIEVVIMVPEWCGLFLASTTALCY